MRCFLARNYLALSGMAFLSPLAANAQSSVTITWSPVAATPVPTLGTYAVVSLAILLAVLAVKVLKNHQRQMALALIGCFTASALIYYPVSEAQPSSGIFDTGCEGQITRPAASYLNVLQNTCTSPISVAYEWESCPVENIGCYGPGVIPALSSPEDDSQCVTDGGQIQPGEVKLQLVCVLGGGDS